MISKGLFKQCLTGKTNSRRIVTVDLAVVLLKTNIEVLYSVRTTSFFLLSCAVLRHQIVIIFFTMLLKLTHTEDSICSYLYCFFHPCCTSSLLKEIYFHANLLAKIFSSSLSFSQPFMYFLF